MSYSKILVEEFLQGEALRVVLNDPKGNVLDSVMLGDINHLLDEVKTQPHRKLLCFSGQGAHFSFGASVPEHVAEQAPAMLAAFHGVFLRLADLAIPTAAAVKGRCLGGGMELASFCHRIVANPDALFAQPEIQLAVLPPVASIILPFKIGQGAADDLNITGRNLAAGEAKSLGLVDEIADEPLRAVEEWAKRELVPKSASSLRYAVRASRWRLHQVLRQELPRVEKFYLEELMRTHDANEGLAAFLAKRKPVWKNA